MSQESIIRVNDVWKRYGLPLRPYMQQRLDKVRGRFNDGRRSRSRHPEAR